MQTIGIDIGTTTIRGVVLEKSGTQKPRVLEAKTIENGSFFFSKRQRTGKGSRTQKRL